jgi:hypothetical protein
MRRLLLTATSVALGLAAGLLVAEVVLRVFHLAPSNAVSTVTTAQFEAIPGIWAPGQDLVDRRNAHLPYHVTTDSLGYRGAAFPLRKEPGAFRVLLTGDSFAFGDFVDDDATLPAQLERDLAPRCAGVRVINAGLDAATIVDEAPMVERGLAVQPDLVVVLFSENDISDLGRQSTWEALASNRAAKSRFPLSVLYPVLRRSALWNFALDRRAALALKFHRVPVDWTARGDDRATARLRAIYRDALRGLRDRLALRHVPLVVLAYPSHLALMHPDLRGQVGWLTGMADSARIPVIDLTAPLMASGEPMTRLYLLPYDGHPSALGYGISASYIADQLTRNACKGVTRATGPVSSGLSTR